MRTLEPVTESTPHGVAQAKVSTASTSEKVPTESPSTASTEIHSAHTTAVAGSEMTGTRTSLYLESTTQSVTLTTAEFTEVFTVPTPTKTTPTPTSVDGHCSDNGNGIENCNDTAVIGRTKDSNGKA